jgi:hypothetical protein
MINTQQERHGEHERCEGLGGRVRRFVYSEVSHFRDRVREPIPQRRPTRPRRLPGDHRRNGYSFDNTLKEKTWLYIEAIALRSTH